MPQGGTQESIVWFRGAPNKRHLTEERYRGDGEFEVDITNDYFPDETFEMEER